MIKKLLVTLQKIEDLANPNVPAHLAPDSLEKIRRVIEEFKLGAGEPDPKPRKESRNTLCARRLALRMSKVKR
jgi:hypothetical protein